MPAEDLANKVQINYRGLSDMNYVKKNKIPKAV